MSATCPEYADHDELRFADVLWRHDHGLTVEADELEEALELEAEVQRR